MTRAIAEGEPDVVFATAFPLLHMYYALRGARLAGAPIVFLGAIHAADTWGYDRKMIYRAIQQADAYIANTTFERDYLAARGIEADEITVVGVGVDVRAPADADAASLRRQHGWGDAPVLAMIAKHGPHKRFDTLLEAMRGVWATHPEVRLVIAGARTAYSPQIEGMVEALSPDQQGKVTVMHDFPEDLKPGLYTASDLLVLPSGYESFGIAFLEAWAYGKAVVGARIGAIPTVISDGQDGLLATYGDADDLARTISRLVENPEERARLGAAGRRKVLENYTWDIVTERVRAVYTDAISRRAQSARNNSGR
jgi:glycosyltransferase involved in cell wall biosynthesis